ncbi:class I SAM-dependent methyltransferase [Sorangium sp. KYC3313]|uniref:class I SAM-dependent methyltransferase n=1 Tax=Sorangium sp. KYC3313 TaxID=3449740 RepID=UPI003F8A1B60
MTSRARTFGGAASAYERFRLGYPDELVDLVLEYAGRPVRSALEIGAGTGKATRAFAARGIEVTATDPDAAMLAELRRQVPASVTVVRGAFEDLPLTRTYDLVFAAAALHWTAPSGRWERVAALLGPDAAFASFGAPLRLADPGLAEAVRAARAPFLDDDEVPSPDGTPEGAAMQWPGTELIRSDAFTDVRQVVVTRRPTVSASDYVGLLATISAYLELPASVRELALAAVRAVLPDRVTLDADLTLHLARRRRRA